MSRLKTILNYPSIVLPQSQFIFILGHMRSRSSVLSHVIGNSSSILGYREFHRSYNNWKNLAKLKLEVCEEFKCSLKGKYILDKVLSNNYLVSSKILRHPRVKIVILLREPEATIKSIVSLGERRGIENYTRPEWATEYYCARLSHITRNVINTLNGNYHYIDSDALIDDTDNCLHKLSSWLGLKEKLVNSYEHYDQTGVGGAGDSSKNIYNKKIVKVDSESGALIPEDMLKVARCSYQSCLEAMGVAYVNPDRVLQQAS